MMQGGECTLHSAGLQAMSDQDTAKGSGCIAVHWEKSESERKYRPDRESTRVISKEGEGSADGSAAAAQNSARGHARR